MNLASDFNSVSRPTNRGLVFNPRPSKKFLLAGKGQLGAVGGGSQTLFSVEELVSEFLTQQECRRPRLATVLKMEESLRL